jgi:hypothetical protein
MVDIASTQAQVKEVVAPASYKGGQAKATATKP